MLAEVIRDLEYQKDRIKTYGDIPTSGQWLKFLSEWLIQLRDVDTDLDRKLTENCYEHEQEIDDLRSAVATLEERIRQAKDIL